MMSTEPQSIIHQIIRIPTVVKRQTSKLNHGLRRHGGSKGSISSMASSRSDQREISNSRNQSWNNMDRSSSCHTPGSRQLRRGTRDDAIRHSSPATTITVISNQIDDTVVSETGSVPLEAGVATGSSHYSGDGTSFHTMSTEDNDLILEDNDFEQGVMERIRSSKSNIPVLPLVTINQNEFMMQCMIDTSTPCFVHFFIDGSVTSEALDEELGQLHSLHVRCIEAAETAVGAEFPARVRSTKPCRFLRMNARSAPFITSKLQVSNQDPSVICFHNGKVFQRIADPDSFVPYPGQVQRWAMDTGLLEM